MESISDQLLELQTLDFQIREIRTLVDAFDPALEAVDKAALSLGKDVETTAGRLQVLRLNERRIELAVTEKQARVERLDERLTQVRNVREEAAVQAELGLVKRALESEEQETLTLLDQIGRLDERLGEQTTAWEAEKAEVDPRRNEILGEQSEAGKDRKSLEKRRSTLADKLDPRYRRVYDNLIRGNRGAVAPMTEDGACGSCYSVIPLQIQFEVRGGDSMVLCEGCGVIVTKPLVVEEASDEDGSSEEE